MKPSANGPRPEDVPKGQEASPVELADAERQLTLGFKGEDPGVGHLALELILIDDDRDKVFRSGRMRMTWLRSAHREIEKIHGINGAEELLQSFTREVIRDTPRALRSLLEQANLIPQSEEGRAAFLQRLEDGSETIFQNTFIKCTLCGWQGQTKETTKNEQGLCLCPQCEKHDGIEGWSGLDKGKIDCLNFNCEYRGLSICLAPDGVCPDDHFLAAEAIFDKAKLQAKMIFDPPFRPFALVYKIPQQERDDGIPQIDLNITRIKIKTTGELFDLVHQEELRKQEVRTEAEVEEFNKDFERLNKEGGFREFVRPWQEQLLFHVMEQQGLLKLEEKVPVIGEGRRGRRSPQAKPSRPKGKIITEGFEGASQSQVHAAQCGDGTCAASCESAMETRPYETMMDQLFRHGGGIGVDMVIQERLRQITEEGFDAKHDDKHCARELAQAAAHFIDPSGNAPWPDTWDKRWDKRGNVGNLGLQLGAFTAGGQVGLLVKAGAMICAEIDRLKRLEPTMGEEGTEDANGGGSPGAPGGDQQQDQTDPG